MARRDLISDDRFVFARRVVTRVARDEDHDTLMPADFERLKANGGFLLDWSAHGLRYGLPITLRDDLIRNRVVVANVSRTVIAQAEAVCANMLVLHVTAPVAVLAQRIAARGRETREDIERRLAREPEFSVSGDSIRPICNDGSLAHGARLFKTALLDYAAAPVRHAPVS